MGEQNEWTCGKGLAANAVLPERMSALAAAMAEVLRVHMEALDLNDEDSRREHVAYRSVSEQLGEAATRLRALATEMAGYRSLPMGQHDMEAMNRPTVRESFAAFVERKRDLRALLQQDEEIDKQMLDEMSG